MLSALIDPVRPPVRDEVGGLIRFCGVVRALADQPREQHLRTTNMQNIT